MKSIFAPLALLAVQASTHALHWPLTPAQSPSQAPNATTDPNAAFLPPGVQLPPPASDEQWKKAVCKGEILTAGMTGTDRAAGQLVDPPRDSVASKFVNFPDEFKRWYYHDMDVDRGPGVGNFDDPWNVGDALRALHVSDKRFRDGGKNIILGVDHYDPDAVDDDGDPIRLKDQYYKVRLDNGQEIERPATGAKFMFSLNPIEGVIMAMERSGPEDSVRRLHLDHIKPEMYPELQKSSDISWGLWDGVAGDNVKNIRYYFSLAITNRETNQLIARAATGGEVKKWPGERFLIADERGKALLGAPNSVCMAFFLMQHKKELGIMYITAANIFACTMYEKNACLMVEVASLG